MGKEKAEVLQGTLDLLILRTVQLEPLHGYGIAQRLEQITRAPLLEKARKKLR